MYWLDAKLWLGRFRKGEAAVGVGELADEVVRGELIGRGQRRRRGIRPSKEGFDNRTYWESRYLEDPERGSGIGSRGKHLEFKRDLLDGLIEELRPRSILDVGCGDLAVVKDLRFDGAFTGIDLSPSIVARNRELRPEWTFIAGDFVRLAKTTDLQAELVICFDVLIHQHERGTYRKFVRRLLGATERVLIVNGFKGKFQLGKQKNICAFHEPLTDTLNELGHGSWQLTDLGKFRSTLVLRVDKRPTSSPGADAADDRLVFNTADVSTNRA